MEDLSLAPTQDLIQELMNRKTFAGIILYSPDTHKLDGQLHENFHLCTTACEKDTVRLLHNAITVVQQKNKDSHGRH